MLARVNFLPTSHTGNATTESAIERIPAGNKLIMVPVPYRGDLLPELFKRD